HGPRPRAIAFGEGAGRAGVEPLSGRRRTTRAGPRILAWRTGSTRAPREETSRTNALEEREREKFHRDCVLAVRDSTHLASPPREERAANGERGAAPGKSGSSAAFRARATRALLGGRRELFFDDLAAAERDDSTELALRLFEGLLAKHGCHLARVAEQLLRSLAEHGERAADGSRRALAGAHDASGNPRERALHAGERAFGGRLPDRLRDLVHEIGRGRGRLVGRVVQARAVAGVRLHELSNLVEREPCL